MWYFILFAIAGGYAAWRWVDARKRRAALLNAPLSDEDWDIVLDMVPIVAKMPLALQGQLQGKVNLFLDQVSIYGKGGLEVSRDMEVSIAAQACLLIVNTDAWYKTLQTVLLYPGAFRPRRPKHDGALVHEDKSIVLGESWTRGPVILSWPHAEQGAINAVDGHNVVIHEFAHQLDALSGHTNAVPVLSSGQTFDTWEAVIMDGFDRHLANVERRRKTVLDDYGATNYVEFLAVSIEVFFEKPKKLKGEYPDLYAQIALLLRLDPLTWD